MAEELEARLRFNQDLIDAPNICERLSTEDLQKISAWTWDGFIRDKASRRQWEQRNSAAMDLAMQIQAAKNFPWPNCSNIIFPLVSIAALQFSTRSYSNLIRGTEIFKYRTVGIQDPRVVEQARLISKHMSWQCLEEDSAWEEQHDRLFINLAIVGTAFIKTRFSPADLHNTSTLVPASDLVMDYYARSVEACARKTEVIKMYRNEIYERCRRGVFRDVTEESWFAENARVGIVEALDRDDRDRRTGLAAPQGDRDTPFTVLEQHRWLDLDGDGYAEPYVVLQESASRSILRIVARVDRMEDVETTERGEIVCIRPTESYTKYGFIPAPDGGVYDMGFGVLLGPLNETVDTAINQIFDAGTSNMLGGGFAASGAKMKAGVYTRTPGEYKIIKGAADDIRKSLVSWPEIPISNVLFQVLSLVIQYADRLAGATETVVGENPGQNTPASTYQGMVEQGTQIYRSIFKRIWRSMKEEGKKLHMLNARFLADSQQFGEGNERITRESYKTNPNMLVPTADPNMVSDQMRLQRASLVRQGAHAVPGYNVEEVEKEWLQTLGVDNIKAVYPGAYSQFAQQHPLPNPKVQVEQLKMQAHQMKFQFEKWKTVTELQAGMEKMRAEVDFIRAQAAKLVADVGAERAAQQLEAFDKVMEHLEKMGDVMNGRIEAMMKGAGGAEGERGEGDEGRAGGAEAVPGRQGAMAVPAGAGNGAAGPMGGGPVQQ
jgi:chaperonin GroES